MKKSSNSKKRFEEISTLLSMQNFIIVKFKRFETQKYTKNKKLQNRSYRIIETEQYE